MNRTIISTDAAEFAHENLKAMFEIVKDGMTQKQREPYVKYIKELEGKAKRSRAYDDEGYFQEQLEELDDEY